jgi:purine-binding chemotaxis protein CheW
MEDRMGKHEARETVAPAVAPRTFVVFRIGADRFALDAALVCEAVRAVWVARLPQAPDVVEGVINLRGEIVPVLDVALRFGFRERPLDARHHFIVANAGGRKVALHVDRVDELVLVDPSAIDSAGRIVAGARHVAGVARLPDGLIVIHDLEHFLTAGESEALDSALDGGEALS